MSDEDFFESEWFRARPPRVQARFRQYPMASVFDLDGVPHWMIGVWEDEDGGVGIWVTPISPWADYDAAVEAKVRICPDHLLPLEA